MQKLILLSFFFFALCDIYKQKNQHCDAAVTLVNRFKGHIWHLMVVCEICVTNKNILIQCKECSSMLRVNNGVIVTLRRLIEPYITNNILCGVCLPM